MSDDATTSAITHGVAVVTGGGATTLIARLFFGGILGRLDKIEDALKVIMEKQDKRHEDMLQRLTRVESKADAAHLRMDEFLDAPKHHRTDEFLDAPRRRGRR